MDSTKPPDDSAVPSPLAERTLDRLLSSAKLPPDQRSLAAQTSAPPLAPLGTRVKGYRGAPGSVPEPDDWARGPVDWAVWAVIVIVAGIVVALAYRGYQVFAGS